VKRRVVIRGTLPFDLKFDDYFWAPTKSERKVLQQETIRRTRLEWFGEENRKWDQQIDRVLRLRAKNLETSVAEDRMWLKYENDREERKSELNRQLTAIQEYYRTEREKELAAEDKARREKAKLVLKEINADIARFDRLALASRGVIRGRRS
jgi:hypothetical protein